MYDYNIAVDTGAIIPEHVGFKKVPESTPSLAFPTYVSGNYGGEQGLASIKVKLNSLVGETINRNTINTIIRIFQDHRVDNS